MWVQLWTRVDESGWQGNVKCDMKERGQDKGVTFSKRNERENNDTKANKKGDETTMNK